MITAKAGMSRRTTRGIGAAVGSASVTERANGSPSALSRRRVRIGQVEIDAVTFEEALETIAALVERRAGGAVFTPNVDHVVKAEGNPDFSRAYERASFCLADGMPILWASRLLGSPCRRKSRDPICLCR